MTHKSVYAKHEQGEKKGVQKLNEKNLLNFDQTKEEN